MTNQKIMSDNTKDSLAALYVAIRRGESSEIKRLLTKTMSSAFHDGYSCSAEDVSDLYKKVILLLFEELASAGVDQALLEVVDDSTAARAKLLLQQLKEKYE